MEVYKTSKVLESLDSDASAPDFEPVMTQWLSSENEDEDGAWWGGDFFAQKQRKTRRQSLEETLYGVFAYSSDSDHEELHKRRRRGDVKKSDLTKPVSFVSEVVNLGEKTEPAGLGCPGTGGLGSAAGREGNAKQNEVIERGKTLKTASGAPSSCPDFEIHTRGIGSKLLEKWGYRGSGGMGRNEQGIAQPIQAKVLPKSMGLGFDREFRRMQQPDDDFVVENPKSTEKLWPKRNRRKKKTELRAIAELMTAEAQNGGVVHQMLVLDMRGPQPRWLTNLENLNAEQTAIEDYAPMPEFQTCNRKLQYEREMVLKDKERLEIEIRAKAQQESVMASVEQIRSQLAEGGMDLQSLADAFARIKLTYPEEYLLLNVNGTALSWALPLMTDLFRGWQLILQPQHGVEAVATWQELLQGTEANNRAVFQAVDECSPYFQLVHEGMFPHIRRAITNDWQPRDPEPMLRFLEAWDEVLPGGVKEHVLEDLVMPKLTAAVDAWDPRLEEIPIHAWLHPWLPWLGSRMAPLCGPIRCKLNVALVNWHPGDSSALALLSPWKTVFDPPNWELLIVRSIMPKLVQAMQGLVINPANQVLNQFHWVMAWVSAVPLHHMINLLEIGFFPKWHEVLHRWLSASPDYDEVIAWFVGWKSLMPTELLANEKVRYQLRSVLELINQAMEGTPGTPGIRPATWEKLTCLQARERRLHEFAQQGPGAACVQLPQRQHTPMHMVEDESTSDMTLKEVVEAYAQESNVQFVPKPGRTYAGLQVYSFGVVNLVIDSANESVLARAGDGWKAVHLDQVLEMHRNGGGSRWK